MNVLYDRDPVHTMCLYLGLEMCFQPMESVDQTGDKPG